MSMSSAGSGVEVPRDLRVSCFTRSADIAFDLVVDDEVWGFPGGLGLISPSAVAISLVWKLLFAVEDASLVMVLGMPLMHSEAFEQCT